MEQKKKTPNNDDPRIAFLKRELEASMARINSLEKENQELKEDAARLRAQVNTLKAHDIERKSMLWKKFQHSIDSSIIDKPQQKPVSLVEPPQQSPVFGKLYSKQDPLDATKERSVRVPKPPPRPTPSSAKEVYGNKVQPPPPSPSPLPPPPPPPPSKLLVGSKAVRRVPEVMEYYRSLMKRDAQRENKNSSVGIPPAINSKNMIGEIENRSTHLLAIKSEVETQGELINFLTREVESAAFTEITDVEAFVKWLDQELSCLVDERAVLKHFPQWPERKADAMREAAFSYRDLKNLESEILSFKNNPKQSPNQSLRRMQALQDRLEQSVNNVERVRDGTSKRYREFHIPWQWMMDTGVIGQIKLSSLTLAKEYMKRIAKELQCSEATLDYDMLLQGVRFAFRVHQFAGGFDTETKQAFEELRKIGTS
ncbi:hypothetical protein LguiA_011956 [Lonicera macranthoides]